MKTAKVKVNGKNYKLNGYQVETENVIPETINELNGSENLMTTNTDQEYTGQKKFVGDIDFGDYSEDVELKPLSSEVTWRDDDGFSGTTEINIDTANSLFEIKDDFEYPQDEYGEIIGHDINKLSTMNQGITFEREHNENNVLSEHYFKQISFSLGSSFSFFSKDLVAGTPTRRVDLDMSKSGTIALTSDILTALSNTNLTLTATLYASNWNNNQQILTIGNINNDSTIFVSPVPTSQNMQDYVNAGIYASEQGNGYLTFTTDTTPITDIQVNIVINNAPNGTVQNGNILNINNVEGSLAVSGTTLIIGGNN